MQFPDDQYVEDEYEHERYGEAEDERVERERGLAAEQIVLRPYDVAAHHVALVHGVGVHDHRYHEYDAERPRGDRHDLRHVRGAHLGRRYRMADGDVPVSAHDHQEYAAGELVHAGRRHVHLDANNGLFKNVSGWGGANCRSNKRTRAKRHFDVSSKTKCALLRAGRGGATIIVSKLNFDTLFETFSNARFSNEFQF